MNRTEEKSPCLLPAMLCDLAIVLLEIIGAVLSWGEHGIGMLQFYTEDSNLLALVACLVSSVYLYRAIRSGTAIPVWVKGCKYIATACLFVTFIVVIAVLAPTAGPSGYSVMLLRGQMLYHHLLCPVLAILSFLFLDDRPTLPKTWICAALIPTVVYAAVTICLNLARVMKGPYPFLRVYEQPVYMSILWCVIILGGSGLLAWALWKGNRKILHNTD